MHFSRQCLLIYLVHVFESEFSSGIKDVTFVLIYMRFICCERGVLNTIRGWFYYDSKR